MKRLMLSILAATTVAAAVPAIASAQPWQPISQRAANLEHRIDMGVRNGTLNPREARGLRNDLRGLVNLESRYRASRPGLTPPERADLDRRYDALSARIHWEKRDMNYGPRRYH